MIHNFPRGLSSFYIRVYQIVDDPSSDSIVSWSRSRSNINAFTIWNLAEFRRKILPKSVEFGVNFSQFVTKLHSHGFERVQGSGKLEFGHEDFVRRKPQLLKKMMFKALKAKRNAKIAKARAKSVRKQVEFLFEHLQI